MSTCIQESVALLVRCSLVCMVMPWKARCFWPKLRLVSHLVDSEAQHLLAYVTFKGWHILKGRTTWLCLWSCLEIIVRSLDSSRCWCTHVVRGSVPLPHQRVVFLPHLCAVPRCRTQHLPALDAIRDQALVAAVFSSSCERSARAELFKVCCISKLKLLCTQNLQPAQSKSFICRVLRLTQRSVLGSTAVCVKPRASAR